MSTANATPEVGWPHTIIGGVRFSCINRWQVTSLIIAAAKERRGGYVCVTGAHGVVTAQDDLQFRSLLNGASLNVLDGQPTVWIARSRGYRLQRVTGREILTDVIHADRCADICHILFGATGAITTRVMNAMHALNPVTKVETYNPPFRPMTDEELRDFHDRYFNSRPTIIWVGVSTPKQELLAARLSRLWPQAPVVAIGAGFEFVAGMRRTAPKLVTVIGFEWLYRLALEPRRLAGRYFSIVPRFLIVLAKELLAGSSRRGGETR